MGKNLPPKDSDEFVLSQKGYKLFKKLGEGSYAPVYLTEYTGSRKSDEPRKLACKVIDMKKAPKDFVKKFLPRELEVLALINHPHIIHVQSIFQRKQKYFIFMSIAEKGDLLDYLLKNGHTQENRARVWFRQITLAVQYLHELGIVHRDLKCENCLISANNNLKLADFGFARFAINSEGQNVTSSTYCGSLNYAAPEVLRGNPYFPKSSDCWSLGVILYAMLNKSMPFEDKNVRNLINQQMQRRWKFRSKVSDSLSDEVKNVTRRLLDPDPNTRWKIPQIIESDWIRMDPRLIDLTPDEQKCLEQARIENAKYIEKLKKSTDINLSEDANATGALKIIKPTGLDINNKIDLMKSQKFPIEQDLSFTDKLFDPEMEKRREFNKKARK
ncbi:testis-specific serine/threonine-protein kinase 1-like [Diorhabda carinulata]|uniref:testis-specific serine/threonine-protein kinase 1-like n=1 Tax=Diorhabda carinulata TaxID=1163345 RepID=UPI0025A06F9D|nr:testis-specific serine/threonine-protein kinase 1-like [Diorhabda carinulata]